MLLSAFWLTVPAKAYPTGDVKTSIRFSCHSLAALQRTLNRVVNEQQVYNANTGSDIFTNRSGCSIMYPGRTFIYDVQRAHDEGVWGYHEVGFWGWLLTERYIVELWRVAHPAEEVVFKGRKISLRDQVHWTVGRMYRRSDAVLDRTCKKRVHERDGVRIYGHQLRHGGLRDSLETQICIFPPNYKSDEVQDGGYRYHYSVPLGNQQRAPRQLPPKKSDLTPDQKLGVEILKRSGYLPK